MGFGLALGNFAGGAATGMKMGMDERRRMAEEKRRADQYAFEKTERERKRAINDAAGKRLAQVGQDVPDPNYRPAPGATPDELGSQQAPTVKYTEPQAYADAARDVGRLGGDPMEAAKLRSTGLQLSQAQRAENQADLTQRAMDIARRVKSGEIDEVEGLRQLNGLHAGVPNGRQAFVTNVNGQPHMVVGDETTRGANLYPITGDGKMFDQAFDGFMRMLTPQTYQQGQAHDLQVRHVAAAEQTARAAQTRADADKDLVPAKKAYYRGIADYGRGAGFEAPIQFVDDKGNAALGSFNRRTGGFQQVQMPQGLHFPKVRGGLQPVNGNPGIFADGTGRYYRLSDRGDSFSEIPTPQSLDQIAATIRDARNKAAGGQGQGIQLPYTPSGEAGPSSIGTLVPRAVGAVGQFVRGIPPADPDTYGLY